jgi:urease accessory protein
MTITVANTNWMAALNRIVTTMKRRLVVLLKRTSALVFLQFSTAGLAFAHHSMGGEIPQTFTQGLLSGLAHPIIGADHLLFLLIAGWLVAYLPGRRGYVVAAVFVVSAALGTGLHVAGVGLPLTESVIGLSVLTGGLLIWRQRKWTTRALSLLFAGFAVFHGYAYAEAIVGAETAPLGAYLLGLSMIQYLVIVGVAAVFQLTGAASKLMQTNSMMRYCGVVVAAIGSVLLLRGFP